MKHPVPAWIPLCGLLCVTLPPPSPAKAPAAVKAVSLSKEELAALQPAVEAQCGESEIDAKQSFRLQQKGAPLDGAMLVGCVDDKVRFGLYREGKQLQLLPEHRANTWDVYQIEAVSFSDIDGDGRFDILAIVSSMAGAGPTAAIPFNVAGVWFQTADGGFEADPKAETVLENVRKPDVKKSVAALKKARVRQS